MGETQRMTRITLWIKLPLTIREVAYKSCVRSAMLHGSEAWWLDQNDIETLQRTERATMKAMCGEKSVEKIRREDPMQMLDLE